MMKLFPELRRPWSDGLVSALGIQDYRDPFEIQFGLFGDDDGGGSDGAADNNPVDADAGRFSGSGNTQAAAGTPSRGTTFGVDGVSKTGSTALDAKIGYTDDDNRGNPGANYNALNNATSEQTTAAIAAAQAAEDRGGSPGQIESAVASALDNYSTGTVGRSGELTDKGKSYIDDIVNQTFAPTSSSLANVGDVTKAQPYTTYLDDELAFTQGMGTAPVNTGFVDAETARVANLTPDQAAAQGVTVAEQRAAQAAIRGQTVNPVTGAFEGINLIDAFSETDLDPAAGQEAQRARAQQEMDSRAQALSAIQNNLGIASASQATAANVLGTTPSDMARIATADAAMDPSAVQVFDASPNAMDAGDMMLNPGLATGLGSLPTPGGMVRDLQAQRQLQGPPQLLAGSVLPERTYGDTTLGTSTTSFLDYPGTINDVNVYSTIDPATGRPISVASPLVGQSNVPMDSMDFGRQLNEQRLAAQSATEAATRQLSPLEQSVQAAVDASTRQFTPVSSPELMGEQAAAGTPAESFYTDVYRSRYPNVAGTVEDPKGNIPGTGFATLSNAIQGFSPLGAISRKLTGAGPLDLPSASEQAAFNSGQLLSLPGATMDEQTGAISGAKAGRGELNMNRFGMVTYSGMPDPSYDGPYANLVNPPADTGGDGDQPMQQATADPCPEGYQLVDGVCQPTDDLMGPIGPAQPGSNFVINPTTGLPTLFQPTTQATQVGQINPFVLQPYTPMQAQNIQQARSGIQALSPTGAAIGRQV